MALFPDSIVVDTKINNNELGIDFTFDEATGQHIVDAGILKECNNTENIQNWIRKVILTELNSYDVYKIDEKDNFGASILTYIGTKNMNYWLCEMERELKEQLIKHTHIDSIEDYDVELSGRKITVKMKVITNGNAIDAEVSMYG